MFCIFFFFNDTATTEIYTLSLHDALPICVLPWVVLACTLLSTFAVAYYVWSKDRDRKSTRLNSSHANISYAVFCLKKKECKLIDVNGDVRLLHTQPLTLQYHKIDIYHVIS